MRNNRIKTLFILLLILLLAIGSLTGCKKHVDPDPSPDTDPVINTDSGGTTDPGTDTEPDPEPGAAESPFPGVEVTEDGRYDDRYEVAAYLILYGHLPENYITKKEAEALGWSGGSVEKYAPGCCIGGDYFGNYEGILPEKKGRTYHECDIDTLDYKNRGSRRLIYSNDGLIYYTGDHYKTYELIWGTE